MSEPSKSKQKRAPYRPQPETLALLRVSGNPINGLGEPAPRPPSPFFWHPPDQHPYGDLQIVARQNSRKCPGAASAFKAAYDYPELIPVDEKPGEHESPHVSAADFTNLVNDFALSHEADDVGIAPMDPLYVFEGYQIGEPWVIVLALAHNYERLSQAPSDETNGVAVCDMGDQYARGTRASYALANWIRSQGYNATPYPGPLANALLLIPPAIEAGLGELGKHGSLISRHFGSGVRLAGVTTDMPLQATGSKRFGADEFCATCQICTRECPPGAISPHKQMVRGQERWYVDFDKCIPYFAEASSCGICIAVCPWTLPDVRPKLLATMARRLNRTISRVTFSTPQLFLAALRAWRCASKVTVYDPAGMPWATFRNRCSSVSWKRRTTAPNICGASSCNGSAERASKFGPPARSEGDSFWCPYQTRAPTLFPPHFRALAPIKHLT